MDPEEYHDYLDRVYNKHLEEIDTQNQLKKD
jgi:hypothetical protein